jgi:hypothetical protein
MHTTILDLHALVKAYPTPHILALPETKQKHIKSIWRHTLRNYKLIHNPPLYNNKTKRASGGVILAVNTTSYAKIKPLHVPTSFQPYLAVAFLYLKTGSKLLAAATYFPQTHKAQGRNTYQHLT